MNGLNRAKLEEVKMHNILLLLFCLIRRLELYVVGKESIYSCLETAAMQL